MPNAPRALAIHPLTAQRWLDFERLFGVRGACGGSWCTFWKLRGEAYEENTGATARRMQKLSVDSRLVPGLLAYLEHQPVGWIAVEPRSAYLRLAHSRALKPLDDQAVWSVTCFFVAKDFRRQGLTVALLQAAVEHVRERGGTILEGDPLEPAKDMPAPFVYTGTASAVRQAGFMEAARNAPTRPIFRYVIGG